LILFIIEITCFLLVKISADILLTNFTLSTLSKTHIIKGLAILDLLRIIYFAAFGTLYWTINNINSYQKKVAAAEINRLKTAKEQTDLEIQLAKAQNAFLQQQINPHLLFNSLNFIHGSLYKLSPEAADIIILLSDIMRYTLEEGDPDGKVFITKETEQIENLITINQYRFRQALNVSYEIEGDLAQHKIIPLVLMTLAENLFKHGDLENKLAIMRLSVKENGELKFYTYNHKRPQPPFERFKRIGIKNIRTRLNYTYGNDYLLKINQTDDIYESELIIRL
jgi:two-component system LytT family sensor kinase